MIKAIYSLLSDGDGNIQVTFNRKGDEYTCAIVPMEKPELALILNGTLEQVTADIIAVSPKYAKVIKTALEKVTEIEQKVITAAKPKAKGAKKEEPKKAAPGLLEASNTETTDEDLEQEAADLEIAEATETIENLVVNETPVEELMPKEEKPRATIKAKPLDVIPPIKEQEVGQIIVATMPKVEEKPVDDNLF